VATLQEAGRILPAFFMSGLYFHIPFCRRKCPYCDFYSVPAEDERLVQYPRLLAKHLELTRRKGEGEGPFRTVFFGGGTPSLLTPAAIAPLLDAVRRLFGLDPGAEISLEANPGTVTAASLDGYRRAGINRISLGIQSLQRENLALLERIHSPEEAKAAVRLARSAGFDNLSCDLMFALPGQGVNALLEEVDRVLDLQPDHLSCYGLTAEKETPFYHLHRAGGLPLPDEDTSADMYLALHRRLTSAGYLHYEVSNYAQPGFQCRHNLGYWEREEYLGIGAGAHSFLDRGWGKRREVPGDLGRFAAALGEGRDPARTLEVFDRRGAMAETLYLGLRTERGVDDVGFRSRFGAGVAEAFPGGVERAGGHLTLCGGRWVLDLEGWLLYDHLISGFL
jgi:oxygen-independent coproporphyrinogen-3 oxidase